MSLPSADNRKSLRKPTTPFRKKFLFIVLVLLWLALTAEVIYAWQEHASRIIGDSDLIAYWAAGQILLQRGNPYDSEALGQVQRASGWGREEPLIIWNPPWTPLLLFPLLLFPFPSAVFLWLCISLILLFVCSTVLWHVFTSGEARRQVRVAWIATLIFMPALFELRIGQISILVLLGVVGFLFFIVKGKQELAGLFLALILIKPHVVYLFLITVGWWILWERRWRVLVGFLSTVAALIEVSLLLSPYSLFYYWQFPAQAPLSPACTATLGGGLRVLFGPEHTGLQFLPALIGGLLTTAWLFFRRPVICWPRDVSLILLCSVSTSAYGWSFDQIILLPLYLQTLVWAINQRDRRRLHVYLMLGALLLINGLLLGQNLLRMGDVFFLWAPLAFGLVYLYGWWLAKTNTLAEVPERKCP